MITCVYVPQRRVVLVYLIVHINLKPGHSGHYFNSRGVDMRGATHEFELRSIKFKKYISGLRSIFLFQKKHNFA